MKNKSAYSSASSWGRQKVPLDDYKALEFDINVTRNILVMISVETNVERIQGLKSPKIKRGPTLFVESKIYKLSIGHSIERFRMHHL